MIFASRPAVVIAAGIACSLIGIAGSFAASKEAAQEIDADDIGGFVKSEKGREAGVWVIAQTHDLPSPFIKIVVTDDQGRYVLPDLPQATYQVWVRGYGLVDSKTVKAKPGESLELTATIAPSAKEAAEYYPANYWLSLIKLPEEDEFPGTGPQGNGIAPRFKTRQEFAGQFKEGCQFCHQLGSKMTRELAATGSSLELWDQRVQMSREKGDPIVGDHGVRLGPTMSNNMTAFGRQRGLQMFAQWTDTIANGALPPVPKRPDGIERNLVLTMWDWGGGRFIHDEITTDKRNPTVNANGPIYGTGQLTGHLLMFDPQTMKTSEVPIPGMDPAVPHNTGGSVHNPMVDHKGRVWMSMVGNAVQPGEGKNPEYCTSPTNKFAEYYQSPAQAGRRISVYDPSTKKITIIPVCFGSHHLNFGYDKDNTLYFSGDTNLMGWINTKIWDETHDASKAIGWCPMVVDSNGDGKITADRNQWNEPGQVSDAKKDTRLTGFLYGLNVSPKDGSVWYAKFNPNVPSGIVRLVRPSPSEPENCFTEYFEPPMDSKGEYKAFNIRGVDIDSAGVAWVAFGSGHLGKFDRTRCKGNVNPSAVGQRCPEGWTIYETPAPKIGGTNIGSDWYYLAWVDLHNVLGLGKDVPVLPASSSDAAIAFLPSEQRFVTLRVPYPIPYFSRGMDARIDDPNTGWKGRAMWSNYGATALWHQEESTGEYQRVVKFQMRPNPLAH
jgi:hypothetical protein